MTRNLEPSLLISSDLHIRGFLKSVAFNSDQKMALKALYLIIHITITLTYYYLMLSAPSFAAFENNGLEAPKIRLEWEDLVFVSTINFQSCLILYYYNLADYDSTSKKGEVILS